MKLLIAIILLIAAFWVGAIAGHILDRHHSTHKTELVNE
jgi:hypothetical protein